MKMAEKVVIGNAELWHGDCRDVLPLLAVHDLLLTDPPYGIGADKGPDTGGTDASGRYVRRPKQYAGTWDEARPTADEFGAILQAGRVAVVWGGNYFSDLLPQGGRWMFWDKLNSMPSYSDGEIAWTNIGGVVVKKFTQCNNGLASLMDGERHHPTQKPVNLIAWCMSFAPDAQTVLDPFMGSGTTGVACAQLGKAFTGIERERKYFDIACERISRAQAQKQLLPPEPPRECVQEGLL
jgi:site-specific DNA-methyltransferase (adenine-specific)/modification methylase